VNDSVLYHSLLGLAGPQQIAGSFVRDAAKGLYSMAMFPYDQALATATRNPPQSIADVLATMQTIDNTCVNGDGLKWFNWLYLQVTQQVENRVAAGGFADPAWLTELDIQFATLYFSALNGYLNGAACPGCWRAMFDVRD
jgi:Family of unknown function (DUF5995)